MRIRKFVESNGCSRFPGSLCSDNVHSSYNCYNSADIKAYNLSNGRKVILVNSDVMLQLVKLFYNFKISAIKFNFFIIIILLYAIVHSFNECKVIDVNKSCLCLHFKTIQGNPLYNSKWIQGKLVLQLLKNCIRIRATKYILIIY